MTAAHHPPGLRKVAIFVASLDRALADRVLEQFPPEQARRVRQAMVELEDIDPEEQRRVIEEFRRGAHARAHAASGIDLEAPAVAPPPAAAAPVAAQAASPSAGPPAPFRFLRDAESDKLAAILASERPQVVALVLSHLPPEQAGKVLVRLSSGLQVEVVRRLVDLEETDPEILREVERGLERRLAEVVRTQRRRVAGLSAVEGILRASGPDIGSHILDNLARHDRRLAERLAPAEPRFEELLALDDTALATLLAAAELEVIALALLGAPPAWTQRLLSVMPPREAEWARQRLASPGPVRLADVEEARRRLAALGRRLACEGRIRSPAAPAPKVA